MTELEIKTYLQLVIDAGKFDDKGAMELDKRGKELVVFVDSLKTFPEIRRCNKCGLVDILDTGRYTLKEIGLALLNHSKRCDGEFEWMIAIPKELLGLLAEQKKEKRTF